MQTREKNADNREKETLTGTIVVIGSFLGALLLSLVRINGRLMPLPLGLMIGSSLAGFEPFGIAGGIVLSACLGPTPDWYAPLVALTFLTATRIYKLIRRKCGQTTRSVIYLVCGAAALPLNALFGAQEVLYGLAALAISVFSGICFFRVFSLIRNGRRSRTVSETDQVFFALAIGTFLIAFSDVAFSGWSLTVMLWVAAAAVAVHVRGFFGAAAAVGWMLMLTLYRSCEPSLIGSAALGVLLGAVCAGRGKPFVLGAFVLSGLSFRTYAMNAAFSLSAPNLLGGLLLYLLVPGVWLDALKRMTDEPARVLSDASEAIERGERRASNELMRMGKLLGGLSGTFRVPFEEEDALIRWTVQGALNVCSGCERFQNCWKDAEAMRRAVMRLAADAEEERRVTPAEPIDGNCPRASGLCASVLLARRQAISRNAVCRQADRQVGFVNRQFEGAGEALRMRAEQMRNRRREQHRMQSRIRDRLNYAGFCPESTEVYTAGETDVVSVCFKALPEDGVRAVKKETEQACGFPLRSIRTVQDHETVTLLFERDAELHAAARVFRSPNEDAVSGDATGECRIPGGRVCFALSDGMGRGESAREESESAIRLLFRLARAGMRKELIYETVNRMLLAQSESETYATLDAVSIDLNTGEAEFLKYGAPPSYLVRNGVVRSIKGEALPCGILAEATPSVIRMRLKRDDRLILCSDGVQDALPDGTARTIEALSKSDPKSSGDRLLSLAKENGGADDMTVMVIRVA
jgi:stage II sporulation protein E